MGHEGFLPHIYVDIFVVGKRPLLWENNRYTSGQVLGKKAVKSESWVQLITTSDWICNLALQESAAITGVLLGFKCIPWGGARGH